MLAPGNLQHTGMVSDGACNQNQTLDMAGRVSATRLTFSNMQVCTQNKKTQEMVDRQEFHNKKATGVSFNATETV